MKKKLCIALTVCLAFNITAGCSKKEAKTDKASKTVVSSLADSGLSFTPSDYVTLGDYKKLKGYDVTCSVSKEELKEEIESQVAQNATFSDITDRGAKASDYITIDYSATVDGKEVEDCKETDYEFTLGYEEFNKKIEDKLVGTKVGDTITVDMKMPDDLTATNVGDKATFTVTVKKLQLETIPTYNLDYVKEETGYDTIDAYEASVKEELLSSKEEEYYSDVIYGLVDEAVKNATFKEDYPEDLYNSCKDEFYSEVEQTAQMFSLDTDEYLKDFCGYTEEDIESDIKTSVEQHLVIYAIAEKEDLFLSDSEYSEYAESVATEYGYNSAQELEEEYSKELVMYAAVFDNVAAVLYEHAELEEITEEKYNELQASEEAEEADAADEETEEVKSDNAETKSSVQKSDVTKSNDKEEVEELEDEDYYDEEEEEYYEEEDYEENEDNEIDDDFGEFEEEEE